MTLLIAALLDAERYKLDLEGVMARPTSARLDVEQSKKLAPGLVRDAALVALADAGVPLEARDVHARVNRLLGLHVPRSSTKGWLYEHAVRHGELVVRVSTGSYALGPATFGAVIERARRRILRHHPIG